MIQITRALARQLKAVFRRAINETGRGNVYAPVLFHAGPEGLRIRIASNEVAVEYHDPTPRESDAAYVPFEFLKDCEAKCDDAVQIEMTGSGAMATWNDNHVPQIKRYDIAANEHMFPDAFDEFTDNPPRLAQALHDAMETASNESSRFALHCVQLRKSGSIAATDASQMFIESGFDFPWSEDLLIPHRCVFGSSELPSDTNVQVANSDSWVCFRIEPWSFLFAINHEDRFPEIDSLFRSESQANASIQIDSLDARFLHKSMKQLPGRNELYSPVTLDANGSIAIRAKANAEATPVELILANSTRTGQPRRINTNRKLLQRALGLGFRELHVIEPDQPVFCQDERRRYLWALLTPSEAIEPSNVVTQIYSDAEVQAEPNAPSPPDQETVVTQPATKTSPTSSAKNVATPSSTEELIEGAEQLKASLRDTLAKTSELIAGLKRHRKEAKIVRTTLDSLRQLQTVG